jgi:Rha family phage regulatory protein
MHKLILQARRRCATFLRKSTSKKGVAGIGVPNPLAAQSRNTAQSCGFFVRAPVLAARMGGRKACRLKASACCPVRQPVRAASLFGDGVAVVLSSNWRPTMVESLASLCAIALVLSVVDGKPTTTSLDIARHFGRPHDEVLRRIRTLLEQLPADHLRNFAETVTERVNPSGGAPIKSPAYRITRDGFTLLAMGFTGKKALQFKLAYIDAFNTMEAQMVSLHHCTPSVQLPALPAPSVDVHTLLCTGNSEPVPLLPEHMALVDQRAWELAGQAHGLIRTHLLRRVAYSTNTAERTRATSPRVAQVVKSVTLDSALAGQHHQSLLQLQSLMQASHKMLGEDLLRLDAAVQQSYSSQRGSL